MSAQERPPSFQQRSTAAVLLLSQAHGRDIRNLQGSTVPRLPARRADGRRRSDVSAMATNGRRKRSAPTCRGQFVDRGSARACRLASSEANPSPTAALLSAPEAED